MKAGPGEIVFHISVWVAVIASRRGGCEGLFGEQAGIAKPEPFMSGAAGLGPALPTRRTHQRYSPGGGFGVTTFPYREPDLEKLYSI
jgi:hypothetical protein